MLTTELRHKGDQRKVTKVTKLPKGIPIFQVETATLNYHGLFWLKESA